VRSTPTGLSMGIDVGGTKVLGVIVHDDGTVVASQRTTVIHHERSQPGTALVAHVLEMARSLSAEVGVPEASLPLGVGMPGMVSHEGRMLYAPNFQSATDAPIAEMLRATKRVELRYLGNDADCAAVCEHRIGAGRGFHDLVMVTLGTGIGGGIILDDRLVRGAHGAAGEFGHMVVDLDGPDCPCGARGCWERFASGRAIERMASESRARGQLEGLSVREGTTQLSGEDVARAALEGNQEARAILDEVAWWLARGIANLVSIVDPALVVLGGGLSDVCASMLETLRAELPGMLEGGSLHPEVALFVAHHGEAAGALGAALLAGERA
jgi:glucokinase